MRKLLIVGVTIIAVLIWQFRPGVAPAIAMVWFFDVGQGDAALIGTPTGYQILIDGGPDESVLHELGEAMPFGDRTIDVVMLSHPHADHYRGLQSVFERYQVAVLLVSVPEQESAEYRHLIESVRHRGVEIRQVTRGTSIPIPDAGQADILYPDELIQDSKVDHPNDASLVAKVSLGTTSVLFPGDAEAAEERQLVKSGVPLDADILKAGHHGSKTSSGAEFAEAVTPDTSIISVGAKNRYRHPSPQTLRTLEDHGSRIYRTDHQGTITAIIGPSGYHIKTDR